jgi:hypothetical protein
VRSAGALSPFGGCAFGIHERPTGLLGLRASTAPRATRTLRDPTPGTRDAAKEVLDLKRPMLLLAANLVSLAASAVWAQGPKYPPLSEFMMPRETEVALARSAAPAKISDRAGVMFAYMWSADQNVGPGVGHWHPHMMVFSPYYENAMLGGNEFSSPIPS